MFYMINICSVKLQNFIVVHNSQYLSFLEVLAVFLATCFGSYIEPFSG